MSKVEKKSSEDRLDRVECILEKMAAESEADFREIRKHIGGFTQTAGEALEEEFADALDEEKRIGDIKVDKVLRNIGTMYEFDAACINGDLVVVVEIKHKLSSGDVKKFAEERLPHFAADCPLAAGKRKVFGAVGGGRITKKAKEEAAAHGLFVLRLRNRRLIADGGKGVRAV